MSCSHKFKIIKEEIKTKPNFFAGKKDRAKIITLQCEICRDVTFRELPAGDSE
jgi:hypothetical protein